MPNEPPISVAAAKLHLRVDHSEEDAYILGLIQAATAEAEDYLGRALVSRTVEHAIPGFPRSGNPIPLPVLPAQSIESIVYVDPDGDEQTLDPVRYRLFAKEFGAKVYMAGDIALWPQTDRRPDAVTINYVAGYGQSEDVPAKVALAIQFLVGHWYAFREGQAVPDTFYRLLDLHGRLIPIG